MIQCNGRRRLSLLSSLLQRPSQTTNAPRTTRATALGQSGMSWRAAVACLLTRTRSNCARTISHNPTTATTDAVSLIQAFPLVGCRRIASLSKADFKHWVEGHLEAADSHSLSEVRHGCSPRVDGSPFQRACGRLNDDAPPSGGDSREAKSDSARWAHTGPRREGAAASPTWPGHQIRPRGVSRSESSRLPLRFVVGASRRDAG